MSQPFAGAVRPYAGPPLLPLALLLLTGGLLGVFAVLVKAAVAAGWPPLAYLFWSLLGAGLILLAVAAANGRRPALDRRSLAYYLGAGLLSGALPNALAFAAIAHVGAGFVALSYAFPPLLTYVFALLLKIERPQVTRAAGLGLALAGVVSLVAAKISLGDAAPFWIVLTLAAPVFVSSGNIFRSRFWPQGASPLSLAPGMLLAGAALLLPYALLSGVPLAPPPSGLALPLLLAEIAVFSATFTLIFTLQAIAGPVYLGQIGSVGAVAGAALAALLLGEAIDFRIAVAAAAILAGVFLVGRKS